MTGNRFIRSGTSCALHRHGAHGGAGEGTREPGRQPRGPSPHAGRTPRADGRPGHRRRRGEEPAGHRRHAGHAPARVHAGQPAAHGLLRHGPADRRRADDLAAVSSWPTMTEAIDPQPKDKVLEIGTGSGYQAAVLSGLVKEVYTIEIVESLGEAGRQDPQAAEVRKRPYQDRRRLPRLAGTCPLRQDHRHLLPGKGAAAAGRPAQGRRADRDPRRRALPADVVPAQEDRRQDGAANRSCR